MRQPHVQRHQQYSIAGRLDDVASQSPGVPSMETTRFVPVAFSHIFPCPSARSSGNVQPSDLWSNIIRCVCSNCTSYAKPLLPTGPPIPERMTPTRGSEATAKPSNKRSYCSLPPGFELESSEMRSKLDPKLWKKPYAGLAARMATRIHFVNVGATVR
jgi:hypothetical protein